MDCSTPGFPVLHYLLKFSQTHVHWVSDAILPSHPLLSPSPPALNFSQHQGLFQWVGSSQSIGASASASVLPMNIQGWFPLGLTLERLSRVFSSTTIKKDQFFSTQVSLWSNSHICTWLLEKTIALAIRTFVSKVTSLFFNTLSRFIIDFLPMSKSLLISWLQTKPSWEKHGWGILGKAEKLSWGRWCWNLSRPYRCSESHHEEHLHRWVFPAAPYTVSCVPMWLCRPVFASPSLHMDLVPHDYFRLWGREVGKNKVPLRGLCSGLLLPGLVPPHYFTGLELLLITLWGQLWSHLPAASHHSSVSQRRMPFLLTVLVCPWVSRACHDS